MKREIDADYFIERIKMAMKIEDGLLGDCDKHLIVAEAAIKLIEEKCFEVPEWHDMRKNPKDLPISGKWVFAYMVDFYNPRYRTLFHDGECWYDNLNDYFDDEVIAWRVIEQFEEE